MERRSRSIAGAVQDLGLGLRLLVREPAFATVAMLTLALGIGSNTAMFGVINAVLLKPFPYRDADGILFVGQTYGEDQGIGSIPPGNFRDWQQNQAFATFARARGTDMSLAGTGEPTQVRAGLVSADVFPLLGIDPIAGRVFGPDDDREGADRVAVLGYGLWQSRFGGDPRVLGRTVRLDDQSYTIVGVMPRGFQLWAADLWVPIGLDFDGEFKESRVVNNGLFGLGRLRPGATLEQAKAEMAVIAARLAQDHPESNQGVGVGIVRLKDSVTSGIRPALLTLLAAVGFVLLIACANVANLLLARAAGREKELAIRTVLGAGRVRLVRQMLLEGLPLAALGGAAGVGLAQLALRGLLAVIPPDAIPAEAEIRLDARVLAFTLAACLLTTVLFGLLPALQASRAEVGEGLREGARGSSGGRGLRLRSALIVGEVALSLALLVGAGLLIKSFWQLRSVDPGFRSHDVLKMEINLPPRKYGEIAQSQAFFEQALERIGGLTGVLHAGIGPLPFGGNTNGMPLVMEGETYQSVQDLPNVQLGLVMGDYFETLGIRVREGRSLGPEDREGAPSVVVVNKSLVRRFFSDGQALGRRVKLGLPDNLIRPGLLPPGLESFPWFTVVGVVDDVKQDSLGEEVYPLAYIPYVQSPRTPALRNSSAILLQASGDPLSLAAPVREQIWSLDRDQAIVRLGRLDNLVVESLRQPRFGTLLLSLFAGLALVLAAVGIYGLVSYAVSQRTRELGIRMALGARTGDVLALILRQGMTLVGAGLLGGLAIALGLSRFLKSLLFQVETADPLTFAVVSLMLVLVALFACYVPARRAVRADPLVALRYE
jgi:putative ABC transport system permease protein